MLKKFGMEKPPFGYFSQVRVHKSSRPKPPEYVPVFPEPSTRLPDDYSEQKSYNFEFV